MNIDWAAWIMPSISGAVGVGMAWGIFKQKIENHADKIENHADKIRVIEVKLENQVGNVSCNHIREQCRQTIKESVDLMRADVVINRELVINELREIHKFMGRMNGQRLK